VTELHDLRGLHSGATGQPAHREPGEELAVLRRQQRQLPLAAVGPLARDSAMAFREVMGDRRQREQAAEVEQRRSTFL
jgi:hypothetical protein